ncbi:MAG: hypothetical protein LUH82_02915 [Clostridiales bacterium]|nr:hypothetical protein [Clostridiales bacterium]
MKLKKKYIITVLASLLLIAALMAAPTYSYLYYKSASIVNNFAPGSLEISLDEAVVDKYGEPVTDGSGQATGERTSTGNSYRYLAGAELTKDPTVTVFNGSDSCYVYVCVVDELTSCTNSAGTALFTVEDLNTDDWAVVSTVSGSNVTTTIYRYCGDAQSKDSVIDASAAESDIVLSPIFTTIKVSEELTQQDIETIGSKTITVTSWAIQSASLTTDGADALAIAEFTS